MKLSIIVKPNSRLEKVDEISPGEYKVSVQERAVEGRANEAVIEALARHFGVPKSRVVILRGEKSRHKRVEIVE